ncbi:hypothetical protein F4859DRAFT_523018 [Xylaria cf. heliscus]|nr:hypothetical protein F4859DRAFT_523018 [Xylaria cf. heliscus]
MSPVFQDIETRHQEPQSHNCKPNLSAHLTSLLITMTIIKGTISGDGNGNFSSDFITEEGVHKEFNGRFTSAVPSFDVQDGTVEFEDPKGLSGTYQLDSDSLVGKDAIKLNLTSSTGKKLVIKGELCPALDKAYTALGSGEWHSS